MPIDIPNISIDGIAKLDIPCCRFYFVSTFQGDSMD